MVYFVSRFFIIFLLHSSVACFAHKNPSSPKTIAITQIVSHPSLDKIRQGILDALKKEGFYKGKNLTVIFDNAQGNVAIALQIAQKLRGLSLDAVVGITTPSAQALASVFQFTSVPVVFAAVTDPKMAGLHPDQLKGKVLITGTSDFPPVAQQVALIRRVLPSARRIGVLYSVGEINAKRQVEALKANLQPGESLVEIPVMSSSEMIFALKNSISKIDVLHIPLDNGVVANLKVVVHTAHGANVPVFTSHPEGVLEAGALACIGIDQYESGYKTGELLANVLKGRSIATIPVASLTKGKAYGNAVAARLLNIRLPKELGESS